MLIAVRHSVVRIKLHPQHNRMCRNVFDTFIKLLKFFIQLFRRFIFIFNLSFNSVIVCCNLSIWVSLFFCRYTFPDTL